MEAVRIALGLIQNRGNDQVPPRLMDFGVEESDFLTRHVRKVRQRGPGRARSRFTAGSPVPQLLKRLLNATDEEFDEVAAALQARLADAMRAPTNPKDCVFAIVITGEEGAEEQVTLLKLDAVLDAAQTILREGRVSLKVLKKLVPEPGKLQKALSWPDEIELSDAIMVDTNTAQAVYFENAYDVRISPLASAAESELEELIIENVPKERTGAALCDAFSMSGPMDEIMVELSRTYPELTGPAAVAAGAPRPSGLIRENRVGATLVYRADGAELRVPVAQEAAVSVDPDPKGDGWLLTFRSRAEPVREKSASKRRSR